MCCSHTFRLETGWDIVGQLVKYIALSYPKPYYFFLFNCFYWAVYFFHSTPFFSPPLLPFPMILMPPIHSGDLVFFYISCRLDPCMSLLGSSLLSRFSGIVICGQVFHCFMSKSHLWTSTYYICLSRSGLPHSMWFFSRSSNFKMSLFYCWVALHCVNVPHFLYLFFSWGSI